MWLQGRRRNSGDGESICSRSWSPGPGPRSLRGVGGNGGPDTCFLSEAWGRGRSLTAHRCFQSTVPPEEFLNPPGAIRLLTLRLASHLNLAPEVQIVKNGMSSPVMLDFASPARIGKPWE